MSTISHCRCVLPFDGLVQFGWNFINFPPIIFSSLGSSSSGGANLDLFALDLDLPFDAALYLALFSLMVASLGACGQSFSLWFGSPQLKQRWMDQSREEPDRLAAVKPEGGTFVNALSQLPSQVKSE